ncbi:ATP12 family chaperone protein [uncultured Thioclava sp.]|uniref:ATP12 family chaperone protein n=1 Tax=uncultured Thioclava sp. TaxID=473858 RepID=UPI002601284A|nr:ATP12 family protein [uncultured Thioclava sp.]
MSEWAAKRFWKEASVDEGAQDFGVTLDGRPLRTPAKAELRVPSRAMAQAIAAEWDAQDGVIRPETMPVTRSANAAIDKVAVQFDEVVDLLAEYGGTDLLCYRAQSPEELVARQAQAWDALLNWAADEYGVQLVVTSGVIPVDQDVAALARLRGELAAMSPFALAAMHDLISLTGSLILGLAVARGRLEAQQAWELSRLDETWQRDLWGADDEADALASLKCEALLHAARFWTLAHS